MHDLDCIRHDLTMLKAWVENWQEDTKHNLPITRSSTDHALSVIERSFRSIDRIEAGNNRSAA
jgi:hypothetical protein